MNHGVSLNTSTRGFLSLGYVVGDFNEILHSGEKQGGLPKIIQPM